MKNKPHNETPNNNISTKDNFVNNKNYAGNIYVHHFAIECLTPQQLTFFYRFISTYTPYINAEFGYKPITKSLNKIAKKLEYSKKTTINHLRNLEYNWLSSEIEDENKAKTYEVLDNRGAPFLIIPKNFAFNLQPATFGFLCVFLKNYFSYKNNMYINIYECSPKMTTISKKLNLKPKQIIFHFNKLKKAGILKIEKVITNKGKYNKYTITFNTKNNGEAEDVIMKKSPIDRHKNVIVDKRGGCKKGQLGRCKKGQLGKNAENGYISTQNNDTSKNGGVQKRTTRLESQDVVLSKPNDTILGAGNKYSSRNINKNQQELICANLKIATDVVNFFENNFKEDNSNTNKKEANITNEDVEYHNSLCNGCIKNNISLPRPDFTLFEDENNLYNKLIKCYSEDKINLAARFTSFCKKQKKMEIINPAGFIRTILKDEKWDYSEYFKFLGDKLVKNQKQIEAEELNAKMKDQIYKEQQIEDRFNLFKRSMLNIIASKELAYCTKLKVIVDGKIPSSYKTIAYEYEYYRLMYEEFCIKYSELPKNINAYKEFRTYKVSNKSIVDVYNKIEILTS